jgi:integrase
MARPAGSYTVDYHKGVWRVRFSHEGKRYERTTGVTAERDRAAATRAGRRIFAEVVSGHIAEPVDEPAPEPEQPTALGLLVSQWIAELSDVRGNTRDYYELIASRWLVNFGALDRFTARSIAAHVRTRLSQTKGKTVRNELSILRKFLAWAQECGALATVPEVPSVRRSVTGTKYAQRRRVRAPELSPEQVEAFLAALPAHSAREGWPIRDRLIVAWETSLRPETLDTLATPDHYVPGDAVLRIAEEHDKEGYSREVPLTARAREALDRCCPAKPGPIFGAHRLDPYVREAAEATLPASIASVLCAQHMRSAAITRMLEESGDLPGTQHMAGHLLGSTTAVYIRPSARAARSVVARLDSARAGVPGGGSATLPPNPPETPAK